MDVMALRRSLLMMKGDKQKYLYAFSSLSKDATRDYIRSQENSTRVAIAGSGSMAGTYTTFPVTTGQDFHVIKIPNGTKSITVKFTQNVSRLYNGDYGAMFFTKDEPWTEGSTYARYITRESYNARSESEKTINVPEGSDSFLYTFRPATAAIQETPEATAEYFGFSITYNME